MRRRTVMRRGGAAVVGTLPLAGCTTDALSAAERPPPPLERHGVENLDLPVTQPLAVAAAGIERGRTAGVDSPEALVTAVESEGLHVSEVGRATSAGESLLSLEYAPAGGSSRGLMGHLGVVAGAYTALVDAVDGPRTFEATVTDGVPVGTYEIERRWAESYLDGTATVREYAADVVRTLETV